jgi:hypothetical protein
MGIDSVYYPPKRTKREKLESFFQLLGYIKSPISYDDEFLQKCSPTLFTYFSQKPYESLQGVSFTVMIEKNTLVAYGRNNISRNKSDHDFHNYTLKQLCEYLGGHFDYGYGKNKYCLYDGTVRENDESGCRAAIEHALGHLQNIQLLIRSVSIQWKLPIIKDDQFIFMNQIHPEITFSNLINVNILTIIETFFKNIYVALLTYNDKKEKIISASKIKNSDLIDIANGKLRLEQVWANNLNFQNVKYICENFKQLDQNLGSKIKKELTKKRNDNYYFYEFIKNLTKHRNNFVHHNTKYLQHNLESLEKDLILCKELIHCIYKSITQSKQWYYNEDDLPEPSF